MTDVPTNNPMKSTWRTQDKSKWTWTNRAIYSMDPGRDTAQEEYPVHEKTDPVPYLTQWSTCTSVFLQASWPIAIHYLYVLIVGRNPWTVFVYLFYAISLQATAQKWMTIMHQMGLDHGFLDGDKHPRDQVPDSGVGKVFGSMMRGLTCRPLMAMLVAYRNNVTPTISWLFPVHLVLYSIVLDFFFYTYHRACHEVEWLWRYHRTHHLTKHPNPMLVIYSDDEQELIEIVLIPLITWTAMKLMGLPMNFYEWWICNAFVTFTELWGHSGLRIHFVAAGPASLILQFFGCELVTEDHDLHHRKGWRKAANYGKQTRLWDRIFGTTTDRIEMVHANVDWNRPVQMPLLGKSSAK